MDKGSLSDYFRGVGAKQLSAVEADGNLSHQHELNGADPLRRVLGIPQVRQSYPTTFMYMCDDDIDPVIDDGTLTWYDARANHPTRSECRLYYTPNQVMNCAEAGDSIIIALTNDNNILALVAEAGSTIGSQISWLFDLDVKSSNFDVEVDFDKDTRAYASRLILQQIVVLQQPQDMNGTIDDMLSRFGERFPPTKQFSDYARSTVIDSYPGDDGDAAIVKWMDQEDKLFHLFEDRIISERIQTGFDDTDAFVKYALSTMNRRKARAGQALENHLCALFDYRDIRYSHTPTTEGKSKPDFIFPSINNYRDLCFPSQLLTMLGAKTTLKDRWRQVLPEADRVSVKHLITLQPAISLNQTDEMRQHNLQLVIPKALQSTFLPEQQEWLLSVDGFIDHLALNQRQ